MRGSAGALAVAFALGGCGIRTWTFDSDDSGLRAESGTAPDSAADAGPTGCANESDCPLPLHCDVISGQCVGCVDSTQCTAPLPHCELLHHHCVQCGDDGDCGRHRVCLQLAGQCFRACGDTGISTIRCLASAPLCDGSRGICVNCLRNEDCADAATGHVCEIPLGKCIE